MRPVSSQEDLHAGDPLRPVIEKQQRHAAPVPRQRVTPLGKAGAFYHAISTADAPERIVRRVTGFAEPAPREA